MIEEGDEVEQAVSDGQMFAFDDEPQLDNREDKMEFVEYPQSPNARSKIILNIFFKFNLNL